MSTIHRDGRSLPWVVLGRQVRPYSLAISLYVAVLSYAVVTNRAIGQLLDGPIGLAIGVVGIVTVGLLWGGWWARSTWAMTQGLLLSACVIASVAAAIFADTSWTNISGLLASTLVVASGGAWLLEVSDGGRPDERARNER